VTSVGWAKLSPAKAGASAPTAQEMMGTQPFAALPTLP